MSRPFSRTRGWTSALASIASLVAAHAAASPGRSTDPAVVTGPAARPPPPRDGLQELLAEEAGEAMATGELARAWHFYWRLLKLDPDDVVALRESGRAAHALGDFGHAERALGRAAELGGGAPDPELHFLRAESLRALGRTDEATREFAVAERELGPAPTDRRQRLWLGRILAVRGELARAEALYERQLELDDRPEQHREILMYLVEAHILADDWAGAEGILRQYCAYWPDQPRASEMLAWVLEARGDLAAELDLRRRLLAASDDRRQLTLAYARVLERASDYPSALAHYREAASLGVHEVDGDIERIEHRLAPELGTALTIRTDPSGSAIGWQAGGSWSLGTRRRLVVLGSHEVASSPELAGAPPMESVSLSALSVRALQTRPSGAVATIAATVYAGRSDDVRLAGQAVLRTSQARRLQLQLTAEANQPWRESPSTIREDGSTDAVTAEAYAVSEGGRIVVGLSGRARRLGLAPMPGQPSHATQLFAAAGLDLVLSASPTERARGELLDHELVWPSALAPALVLGLRHYELASEDPFGTRLVLVERSRLDEISVIARTVAGDGVIGTELRGGLGYDWERAVRMWRTGASLLVSVTPSSRFTIEYDLASESATSIAGRRHTGIVGLHVDL